MVKQILRKSFFLIFFLFLILFRFQTNPKVVFGSPKVPRNENILRKMIFFSCLDVKENQIYIKIL